MIRCTCSARVPADSRFCPRCGATLAAAGEEPPTRTVLGGSASLGSETRRDPLGERFLPGVVLGRRYRIVGRIGRGGMGEVYRADDLKLGQPVALKFVSDAGEGNERRLLRFLDEVRLSLRISHPNVCRVYDVEEVEGHHFLSMELVDGEDLASLLRRIGRLPRDKAVQVARQLCAGLAAAHQQGILHRDLKPANVLIDGRGQVKITDFGLAGLAGELRGPEARAGTPAYMAPEQWAGQEVTVRSDLYALGLLLYEIFTGKRAFPGATPDEVARLRQESQPTSPSSLVDGLDPAVERVILRCLESDPGERPASALAVAAGLPGGDPLAAALAAGETPSPDLVAQAGGKGGLSPTVAWSCLGAFLAGLAMVVSLGARTHLVLLAPLDKPPQVLAERATEIIRQLGYEEPPADRLWGFMPNVDYLQHLAAQPPASGRWEALREAQPPALGFWYRQSPRPIEQVSQGSVGNEFEDPPPTAPGMVAVVLDTRGRLRSFHAVPLERSDSIPAARAEPAGAPLLVAAGFGEGTISRVEPEWTPPVFAEQRMAWEAVYPDSPRTRVRLEAAFFGGRAVAFRIVEPWTRPAAAVDPPDRWAAAGRIVRSMWFLSILVAAAVFARRNLRLGRGDRKAALRFALYLGGIRLLWLLVEHHVPAVSEMDLIAAHLAWASYRVCLVWAFYLALEPYVRRLWPRVMVSWVRLVQGGFRDPLVGRDVLVGTLIGVASALVSQLEIWVPDRLGLTSPLPEGGLLSFEALRGARFALGSVIAVHTQSVLDVFYPILGLLLVRFLVRKTWIAVAVVTLLAAVMFNPEWGDPRAYLPAFALQAVLLWATVFRFGFLSVLVAFSLAAVLQELPLTVDPTSWYAGASLLALLAAVGPAVYAFRVSLAGRSPFGDPLPQAQAARDCAPLRTPA